ncbi:MAG: phosphatidylserine decarboxylase family protein [Bacteroidota bacterium]|nr:phosphatidylserine decarboxylase family protein [Bacteroidota bacterium]
MTIHKEGKRIIFSVFLLLVIINCLFSLIIKVSNITSISVIICSFLFFLFIVRFFRKPKRQVVIDKNNIYAPADGHVVVIEKTNEDEYYKDKRIQISIFMSVWNIHINWFPISGIIKYFKYHPGKFIVAKLPKSSTENERTTVVIENNEKQSILVRQIAGAVARRIVYYSKENKNVEQASEMGFIKFGSRLDVFLPLDAKINVDLNQNVKGKQTVIASFK